MSSTASQLTITELSRRDAYDAAAALQELIVPEADAVSVFEDGSRWRVDAYYADASTADAALAGLTAYSDVYRDHAAVGPVADENWVAISQAALPPVVAGRFTIVGEHDRERVPAGPNTLLIEAGEAFGTAHHATTYGCLLALDRLVRRKRFCNILDLGTGSGVLALALERALPDARIVASDIDARSIEVARENAQRNGLGVRAGGPRFICADGVSDPRLRRAGPFDLVVANILAGPLIEMAEAIVRVVAPGGTLVLSGILTVQARQVQMRYRGLGLRIVRHDGHEDWSTLVLENVPKRPASAPAFNLYVPADD